MSTTPESPNPLGQPLAWDLVADGYTEELEGKVLQDLVARFGSGPVPFDAVAFLASGRRAH